MNNPFSLTFGIEPKEYIIRKQLEDSVIESFESETPSNYMYMLSGMRGVGKTVVLSSLTEYLSSKKNWVVINVSPDMDILNVIAANLYGRSSFKRLFKDAKIDLSALGIGISIKNSSPVYDITVALEQLISELKKKDYRVLIAIDEVVNSPSVRLFAGTYQILLRKKLPVFLLMTGLYENINNLQNEKTLTFLYRAPKIYLEPLSMFMIAKSYRATLGVDEDVAKEMARLTKGYAYAYQVLGYLYWDKIKERKSGNCLNDLLDEYDATLSEYVYEKIWSELPETELAIVTLLVKNGQMKIADVKSALSLSDSKLSVYRDRLKRRGLIDVSQYGRLSLLPPRFREIATFWVD
ncbi:MAG: ATP-binding protein [Lachnospiraceae bacterium]|nr:ATP-binding protein [Lachnospiraceae bacterium]